MKTTDTQSEIVLPNNHHIELWLVLSYVIVVLILPLTLWFTNTLGTTDLFFNSEFRTRWVGVTSLAFGLINVIPMVLMSSQIESKYGFARLCLSLLFSLTLITLATVSLLGIISC